MTSLRDQAARRRVELNPLTTSLNLPPQVHPAPGSALSATSLSAPFAFNQSAAYTPISAVRQYNPQQWTPSPSVNSDSNNYFLRPAQESDTAVAAPPPYSPPRSQWTSGAPSEEPSSAISPATRISPALVYRSSPEPSSNPVFPPPPPSGRARAASNDRPLALFNAFSRRSQPDASRIAPEVSRENAPVIPRRLFPIAIETSQSEQDQAMQAEARPPASRRAASTGAISTPTSSRASSTARWEPGMPLPPPPAGPPPAQSRSQSLNRTDHVLSPPTRRPPPSSLGPVPPTPAGWVDESTQGRARSPNTGLVINTSTSSVSSSIAQESNSGSSSSGLNRHGARRGEPKSIRERRSESRTGKSVASDEASNNPWAEAITPGDIVVPNTVLGRRPPITKSTPRSARSSNSETPRSSQPSQHNTPVPLSLNTGSRGSTPRPLNSSTYSETPTPPFSSGHVKSAFTDGSPTISTKPLPTPPTQSRLVPESPSRPVSHILHIPNNDSAVVPPLVPSKPASGPASRPASRAPSRSSGSEMSQPPPPDQFARSANERHIIFALKEAAAKSDEERVRMFAEFIVAESRLRRERYATAIDGMGSEILELTRDLFRPYNPRRESTNSHSNDWTPESSAGPRSHRGSMVSNSQDTPQIQSEPASDSVPASPAVRPDSTWWNNYMPSLSPIPSMSVSEALDPADSRGRPSSRWWEVSQEGSTGAPSTRLERSKRETKYMGMPKELREALQYGDGDNSADTSNRGTSAGPSTQMGPDEYPPEKVGLHEQNQSFSSARDSKAKSPATPFTPNAHHLDVSRLVTLPPPYPRHHPAVNNNHPELTSIRTIVRTLSDFSEVEATKERFTKSSTKNREENTTAAAKRRSALRINIQRELDLGNITYADAAEMEAAAKKIDYDKTKEAGKADFELFQSLVVIPVNDLLMDRISRATELFEQLRSRLFVDAQEQSPNIPQEEGDEQPELLEKLTLLKWIFEAREQLHRELYDLLSDRNDRYKDMVITPYRLANNEQKIKNAETFFAEDGEKRKLAFETDNLKRTEEFLDIVEENVVRGVEVQLSAFWDIAPSLSRITDKIPSSLFGFQIQIPPSEYEENPSYYKFPMQYLYSLLSHCEKSTYQFIESQINLLCLLHEVKSVVTLANCRLMRSQRVAQGEDGHEVEKELAEVEKEEERRLTDDLKEKVRCVEELWGSGLGTELKGVKERIREFLGESGGWDDDVQEV